MSRFINTELKLDSALEVESKSDTKLMAKLKLVIWIIHIQIIKMFYHHDNIYQNHINAKLNHKYCVFYQ